MGYYFETKDLTVGYHGRPLIENISIGIEKGEIVTLIGPNGSGKSTILKSITRHLATIAGTVFIDKDEMNAMSYRDLSRKVAVVLTERIRPELMTCREVVASGRYPYTNHLGVLSAADQEIVDEAMERVSVLELSQQDFGAISDGQRQRVLLARAICQQPEIIVLDEPTSFLDIRHKVELLAILRKMAKQQGTTVLMSLHEIDLAQKISDRVICVKGDHIHSFGRPEEIFRGDTIRQLYEIGTHTFNLTFGSIELPKAEGKAETFVISAAGSGIETYRRLQKEGVPFIAGILYENDIDCPVAEALGEEVITEKAFEPISDETFARALDRMLSCKRVLICHPRVGTLNRRLQDLMDLAMEAEDLQCQLIGDGSKAKSDAVS